MVMASPSGVDVTWQRHAGKRIDDTSIVVEGPGAVDDVKIMCMQHASPARVRPFQSSAGHQSFKWLMICDNGEMSAVQEMTVDLAPPHGCQPFDNVGAVVALMFACERELQATMHSCPVLSVWLSTAPNPTLLKSTCR